MGRDWGERTGLTGWRGTAHALSGLLKDELNFQGAIISDWGAVWGERDYIERGLDGIMPGLGYGCGLGCFGDSGLVTLVKNGTVPEERLADATIRMLLPCAIPLDPQPVVQ